MSPTSAPSTTTRKAATPRGTVTSSTRLVLLVATRKGAWLFHGDRRRKAWKADGPHFLGHDISHVQLDPRDGRTLLAAAKTGHLGPTVFRSTNLGRSWKEARRPPAFAKPAEGGLPGRAVDHTFWLTPGHASERGSWYAGTSPQGLFRSEDGGSHLGAAAFRQRRCAVSRVDGHGAGRHAGRAEAAFHHRRSARPGAPVFRDVGWRRARVARRRAQLDDADQGPRGGRGIRCRPA